MSRQHPTTPPPPPTPPHRSAQPVDPPAWRTGTAAIRRLAADLAALPYTTEAVEHLLGPAATDALDREQAEPARRVVARLMSDAGTPASQRALAAAVSAWLLGDPVPTADLDRALPTLGADGAAALNLGRVVDGILHPVVDLSPYATDDHGDLWVASDQTALQTRSTLDPWHVVGIGRASLTLAGNIIREPVARALDLGTGCGIQTLHLLAHAGHVTATDLSERALDFTAFNLVLNEEALGLADGPGWDPGTDPEGTLYGPGGRVTLAAGDLLRPVAGQRFDLVVSNPPFVITPRTDPAAGTDADEADAAGADAGGINTYRDGGRAGDSLLADLVATLAEHLEPGGTAQLLGNWEIHRTAGGGGGTERVPGAASPQLPGWDARPLAWVPAGVDAWFIQRDQLDPAGYAETWLQDSSEQLDPAGYAQAYRRYLADFETRGVAAVGFGYLWLRRPETGRAGRIRTEVLEADLQQPLGPAWGAAVRRWDVLADADAGAGAETLRDLHVRVPSDVTEERYQRFGAEHPEVILARQGAGFRRTAHLDTATAGFLAAADGEYTVGQLVGALSGLLDLDASGERALLDAVAELFSGGFLVPVTEAATPAGSGTGSATV